MTMTLGVAAFGNTVFGRNAVSYLLGNAIFAIVETFESPMVLDYIVLDIAL